MYRFLFNNERIKYFFCVFYFLILFFFVLGIRIFHLFNFKISLGYNLNILAHINNSTFLCKYDFFMNILLFIYFPFAFNTIENNNQFTKKIIFGICTSVLIEVLQFFTKCGFADINDVISNTIGVLIGCLIFFFKTREF